MWRKLRYGMRKVIVFVVMIGLLLPTVGMAYFKSLSIPQIPQEEDYYCNVSVIEMWIEWLHDTSEDQDDIADDQGVTSNNGLTASEMANAL